MEKGERETEAVCKSAFGCEQPAACPYCELCIYHCDCPETTREAR